MNAENMKDLLRRRCDLLNRQLVNINDEFAALNMRTRDLERVLLQTMGQKMEAELLIAKLEEDPHAEYQYQDSQNMGAGSGQRSGLVHQSGNRPA
jgi:hypothetical protein